jgi:hypothetical protein
VKEIEAEKEAEAARKRAGRGAVPSVAPAGTTGTAAAGTTTAGMDPGASAGS